MPAVVEGKEGGREGGREGEGSSPLLQGEVAVTAVTDSWAAGKVADDHSKEQELNGAGGQLNDSRTEEHGSEEEAQVNGKRGSSRKSSRDVKDQYENISEGHGSDKYLSEDPPAKDEETPNDSADPFKQITSGEGEFERVPSFHSAYHSIASSVRSRSGAARLPSVFVDSDGRYTSTPRTFEAIEQTRGKELEPSSTLLEELQENSGAILFALLFVSFSLLFSLIPVMPCCPAPAALTGSCRLSGSQAVPSKFSASV